MEDSKAMGTKAEDAEPNVVAIVGMAGRFPGAPTLKDYWANVRDGKESIHFYTDEELSDSVSSEILRDPRYINAKGALAEAEGFDSRLFGVSPSDAEILDPQHRALLECAWAALEDAGYACGPSRDLQAGVFAGCAISTYLLRAVAAGLDTRNGTSELQWAIGNDKDFLASRVSHQLGLVGPSVTVQAACATSLAAVHLACQSLLTYECDLAVAGGVAITFPLHAGYFHVPGGIASSDGHCRAFDAASDGTVSGNGVGVVVLKRLADALKDRDTILAVVRGSAMNNDGRRKLGYTAPSVDGQAEVIAQAFAMAGCDPSTVGLLEAHGTGTRLGDPIEVSALRRVFLTSADGRPYCALGSVKTNIGHLDAAAGVAGLIKAVLSLRHRTIPPSLHFQTPNPEIDWEGSPFYVPIAAAAWSSSGPLRAGVSSFGLGGTNVHLVLEEAPDVAPVSSTAEDEAELLVLSAATPSALLARRAALREHLERATVRLEDVAHTLQIGRRQLAFRWQAVARSRDTALAALVREAGLASSGGAGIAFLFPGQGVAYEGTTAGLYARESVFRSRIDRCDSIVRAEFGRSLFAPPGQESPGDALIDQPAIFAIGLALADLWRSWGARPAALLGHSLGEYTAACVAGVFDEDDALRLVCRRAELVAQFASGAMVAVLLSEAETRVLLPPKLAIAAINREDLTVVSGPRPAIDAFKREVEARRIAILPLRSHHAFHSAMLDEAIPAFRAQVSAVRLRPPRLPVVSNVTGDWLSPQEATDPEYWVRHFRNTVRFAEGIRRLRERDIKIALEFGPGLTLGQWITPTRAGIRTLPTMPSATDSASERAFILSTLGQVWQSGVDVDWAAVDGERRRGRIPLPIYPFERQRFAIDLGRTGTFPRAENRTAHEGWYWTLGWSEKAAPTPAQSDYRGWLVVAQSADAAAAAVGILRVTAATRVAIAIPGSDFAMLGPGEFRFRPNVASDVARMVAAARNAVGELGHVLYTLTLAQASWSADRLLGELCGTSFFTPLHLIQALGGEDGPVEVIALADGMHRVGDSPAASPEKAALIGLCRVVPREHPNVTFRCIDLPEHSVLEGWADRLSAELSSDDPLVAWRNQRRFVPESLPARPRFVGERRPELRNGGVYLVTGGLGGIGLTLATMLAREHRAKLVLTSRTELPAADEWEVWLETHAESDARSRAIRAVRAIAAAGGEVLVLAADVSDRLAMTRVRREIEARFGVLNGIVHAAGVAGGGMIARKTAREAARVLSPKVIGARLLEDVFGDLPIDFVVHCSSLSSLHGDFGQLDYCAANACLDALGGRPFGTGGAFVLTINWDTWRDVGMAATVDVPAELRAEREKALENGIDPVEGARAFTWALSSGLPQVAVSPRGLPAAISASRARNPFAAMFATTRGRHQRPESATPYVAPRSPDEAVIAELWAEALGIDGIGVHDSFFDLGGHSLIAMHLVHRIVERLGLGLTLKRFLDAPTIAAISATKSPEQHVEVPTPRGAVRTPRHGVTVPDFSLFFFSAAAVESGGRSPYRLLRESAEFADRNSLHAVWVPERHFDCFGGLYPSPSVVLSALSTITQRVKLRAGSIVLPLQNPLRVAEELSVIDNLSGGRVGVAFASGWHANDFVLAPQNFADRRGTMMRGIDVVKQLWLGKTLQLPNGVGELVDIQVLPRPVQAELPIWLTAQSNETFVSAGKLGANVLTSLLSPNTPKSLAANVAAYRAARAAHGHDPDAGRVTLMLHTFLGSDSSAVRETARRDYAEYVRVNVNTQVEHARAASLVAGSVAYDDEELAALTSNAFRRIAGMHGLVGTPEECVETVVAIAGLGVDEIACLIDFVADPEAVLGGLPYLTDLRARVEAYAAAAAVRGDVP